MMTRRRPFLLTLLVAGLYGCGRERFRVIRESKRFTVDCQRLGEYPSTVTKIVLRENTGRVVWEVVRESGSPQLHKIVVAVGVNSGVLEGVGTGVLKKLRPEGDFELMLGRVYEIEVVGEGGTIRAKEEFSFR